MYDSQFFAFCVAKRKPIHETRFRPDPSASSVYPGAAGVTPAMSERMRRADAILFDGTLSTDDRIRIRRKIPLISSPMQVSTSVGVVEIMESSRAQYNA